jgi:hypothetical protein
MSARIPDSSGLPLRAMVMVLVFLGVIFLLLGLRAVGSSGSSDDYSSSPASTTGTTTAGASSSTSGKPAPNQAEVRVYNISQKDGIAAHAADQLKAAGFKVTEVTNMSVSDVSATTVYYGDAEGERATADAVGKNLGAPVEARIDALKSQPAGVIVLVTG